MKKIFCVRNAASSSLQDPTSGTLSRLYPSTKYLHGVLEDRELPYGAGAGVRVERTSIQIFAESFIKIQHQEPCQDSTRPPSLFMESWRTGRFLMDLERSSTQIYTESFIMI